MRAHFVLYVSDQASSTRFYCAVLASGPTLDVPGMTEFDIGGCVVALMPESGIARLLQDKIPPFAARPHARAELYLRVDNPAAYHARALLAGARELSPLRRRDWGDSAAYSLDADGYVLAFATQHDATHSA